MKAYNLSGIFDCGHIWRDGKPLIYVNREDAEKQMAIEIGAYTWNNHCPVKFTIEEIDVHERVLY